MLSYVTDLFHTYSFQLIGALEMGLIYGLVAMGVFLTFRILDFPDLTADGSFPLGASITAVLLSYGILPWVAMLASMAAGAFAGFITAWLNVRWRILNLLAGILTMTALYSINLRIMGRPNMSLLDESTLFSYCAPLTPWQVLGCVCGLVFTLYLWFINSEVGLALRAVGANKKMAQAQGISVKGMTLLGLAFSNALISLGGSLFAQHAGFSDVSLGVGTIIFGLAAVIMGEVILPSRHLRWMLAACVIGSIVYRLVIAGALNMTALGMQASDLNLITAFLVISAMVLPRLRKGHQA